MLRVYQAGDFVNFQDRLDIPIYDLAQGMYVAHFKTKNQTVVRRFVVSK